MLDVTPWGPYSIAMEFESESMPALATPTWAWSGVPR